MLPFTFAHEVLSEPASNPAAEAPLMPAEQGMEDEGNSGPEPMLPMGTGFRQINLEPLEYVDRKINNDGYATIRRPDNNRWQLEHHYVMELMLGRKMDTKFESVHHKNGIRDDNNPDNLELWVTGIRYGQRAKDVKCPHCGKRWSDI